METPPTPAPMMRAVGLRDLDEGEDIVIVEGGVGGGVSSWALWNRVKKRMGATSARGKVGGVETVICKQPSNRE